MAVSTQFTDSVMSALRVKEGYTLEDVAFFVGRSPRAVSDFLELVLKEGIVKREHGRWFKVRAKLKKRAGTQLDLFK